jgi:hypothetical protein
MSTALETPLTPTSIVTGNPLVKCQECEHTDHWLGEHIPLVHGMALDAYLAKHPGASLRSSDLEDALAKPNPDRLPQPLTPPMVMFGNVPLPVNLDVPQSACLKEPEAYRIPQCGQLAEEVEDAALAVKDGVSLYVHGRGGSGKDALFHSMSAMCRMPAEKYQVTDSDIQSWFFTMSFDGNGTIWKEGPLLKQLRDGYLTPSGRRVPYLILITDWDRASPKQAEFLRLILDSIDGRVPGPEGVTYAMFPGTLIVATGNTAGGGDTMGRYVSARPMDATMMERWGASFHFTWMDWDDEVIVLREKFPLFTKACAKVPMPVKGVTTLVDLMEDVGKVTRKLRAEIHADRLYTDFSHRHLDHWLRHCERRINHVGRVEPDLLKRSAKVWLSRISDEHTRLKVIKLMDPDISGGMLEKKKDKKTRSEAT